MPASFLFQLIQLRNNGQKPTDKCIKTVCSVMYKTRVQLTNVYKALGSKQPQKWLFWQQHQFYIFTLKSISFLLLTNISATEGTVLLGKPLEQYWKMFAITEGNRIAKSDNKIIKPFMKVTGESSPDAIFFNVCFPKSVFKLKYRNWYCHTFHQ